MKQKSIYILIALFLAASIFASGFNYGQKNETPDFGQIPEQLRKVDVLIDNGSTISSYKANSIGVMNVLGALRLVTSENKLIFDYV